MAVHMASASPSFVRQSLLGRQLRIIPFGDSITQGSTANAGGYWQYSSNYAETAIYLAGPRFTLVRNAGLAGDTTTQMLARIQTDVLAYSPDVVLLLGGTNDFSAGMANIAFTTMFQNLETMVRRILASGAFPVIVTCPPKNTAAAESRKAQVFYYMLAKAYGLPLIDAYRCLVDPVTGNYQASLTGDGTHPNAAGITIMAAAASAVLQAIPNAFCGPYLAAYSETSVGNFPNLIRNGSFAQESFPPAPDGWTINTTNATYTTPAATPTFAAPFTGNTFNYVKTGAGGVYALSGGSPTGWAVGDTLVFSGRIKTSGRSGATGLNVGIGVTPSGNQWALASWLQDGDFLFSNEFQVQAGATALTPVVFTTDVGTYLVNNLTLWNKTAAQAIFTPAP